MKIKGKGRETEAENGFISLLNGVFLFWAP